MICGGRRWRALSGRSLAGTRLPVAVYYSPKLWCGIPDMTRQLIWFCVCALLVGCGENPTSDDQLIRHFRTHRAVYENALAQLSQEPVITRVEFVEAPEGGIRVETMPDGIVPARLQGLESLHRKTSVSAISAGPSEGPISSVHFFNYRVGIMGSGVAKGIAFEADPNFLAKNHRTFLSKDCLDRYTPSWPRELEKVDGVAYCMIEEHWYLFISQ